MSLYKQRIVIEVIYSPFSPLSISTAMFTSILALIRLSKALSWGLVPEYLDYTHIILSKALSPSGSVWRLMVAETCTVLIAVHIASLWTPSPMGLAHSRVVAS